MRMMRNDEYIIVCTFGGRRMNGFEVIEEGPQAPTPSRATVVGSEKKKKLCLKILLLSKFIDV